MRTDRQNNLNVPLPRTKKVLILQYFKASRYSMIRVSTCYRKIKIKIFKILTTSSVPIENFRLMEGMFETDSLLKVECK